MTEIERYNDCLKNNKPYFGSHMCALQGNSRRHIYMQELVRVACSSRGNNEIRILEIGSWAGGSAISWAEAIKKYNNSNGTVICIDPWAPFYDPATIDLDNDPFYEEMFNHSKSGEVLKLFIHNISAAGYSDIICPFRGSSDRLLPLLSKESFDIVFIDGDHRYAPAFRDIFNSVPLLKTGGYLCGDDLDLQFHQIDTKNALTYSTKDFIMDPKTQTYFHPGVSLAVGKLIGTVSVYEGFWLVQKDIDQWDLVDLVVNLSNEVPRHLQ